MDEPKLPLPVAQVLAEAKPPRTRDLWEAIEQKRARKRSLRHAPRWAAVTCVAAAAALFWLRGGGVPASPSALGLKDQTALPASLSADSAHYRAIDLSDGSRITMARGAKLDVLIASPKHVELVLREGRARFDVRPRGPRSWRIQSSGVSVDVVGTSFVVERTADAVNVEVLHGIVLVRAPGLPDGVQRLNAGDRACVQARPSGDDARTTASATAAPAVVPSLAIADIAAPTQPVQAPARAAHAQKGAASSSEPSATALWRAADEARLRHAPAEAIAILSSLQERDVPANQRALAAFTSGKLALDELAQPAQAARDLASALALGLPSPLDIDARNRLVEAYARSNNPDAACDVVRDLEARGEPRPAKFMQTCGAR